MYGYGFFRWQKKYLSIETTPYPNKSTKHQAPPLTANGYLMH